MERNYYEINESMAKLAHDMMSYFDYKPGSKTEEYRSMVDKAYEAADKAAKERPDKADKVYRLADLYAKKLADNMNKDSSIGTRCPSVLVAGGSGFPTRKKEKQVMAWDRNYKEWEDIQNIIEKINSIRRGKDIIQSDDEDAVERLEEKLAYLKAQQERMKAANRAIRIKDADKGNAKLREMGYSDAAIKELRSPDFCGRIGYANYMLANNNANIHRIENRIKALEQEKEAETQETENEFFKAVENTDDMRLQLFFDGKPDADVRAVLKSNGFRWAPSKSCWQRLLNDNARYAAERVIKELKSMDAA